MTAPELDALTIVEVPAGHRGAYQDLLRLADDSETAIAGYRDQGQLFGLLEPDGDQPRGHVLAIPNGEPETIELMSIAVAPAQQGRGLGRRLLLAVLERLAKQGWRRVVVATATSSLGAIAFYQRLGFRMLRIERDAFSPATGYPADLHEHGIPVRDRVWLDHELGIPGEGTGSISGDLSQSPCVSD
ncbi:MAG: GNAT family N-acetyltransferase [Myxococcota bacterium]